MSQRAMICEVRTIAASRNTPRKRMKEEIVGLEGPFRNVGNANRPQKLEGRGGWVPTSIPNKLIEQSTRG